MSEARGNVILANESARVVVSPGAGASLRSLRVRVGPGEHELLAGGEGPHTPDALPSGTGSFVMAPWVNRIHQGRLRGPDGSEHVLPLDAGLHAIHGTVRRAAWQVVRATERALECRVALGGPWPFRGSVSQTISLEGSALRLVLTVASEGVAFPAGVGWHPWFRRALASGAPMSVQADVGAEWELDASMIPTGRKRLTRRARRLDAGSRFEPGELDCCFDRRPGGRAVLTWPELELTIGMSAEVSHLMVYSPEHAICVEPQTSAVNAFQLAERGHAGTGARVVTPERPLVAATTWAWR